MNVLYCFVRHNRLRESDAVMTCYAMQGLNEFPLQNFGTIWLLWPESGFPYVEGQSGLDLLDKSSERVLESLVIRDQFITPAKTRLQALIKKV